MSNALGYVLIAGMLWAGGSMLGAAMSTGANEDLPDCGPYKEVQSRYHGTVLGMDNYRHTCTPRKIWRCYPDDPDDPIVHLPTHPPYTKDGSGRGNTMRDLGLRTCIAYSEELRAQDEARKAPA